MAALYPWLKALHVASAIVFAGAVLALASFLAMAASVGGNTSAMARHVLRWQQVLATPAMLSTWMLGLLLASAGAWFPDAWLVVKLAFVLLLSALHGMLTGHVRRLAVGGPGRSLRWVQLIALICVTAIAVLAVVKP